MLGGHVEKWHIYSHNHRPCTTQWSTSSSLGDVSWVQKAASQPHSRRRNVPLLHMSTHWEGLHMINFTRPSQCQPAGVINDGVRRPGYKVKGWPAVLHFPQKHMYMYKQGNATLHILHPSYQLPLLFLTGYLPVTRRM